MQMLMTFVAVVAGLVFSLAVALLTEEFIFGQILRLFAVRQPNDPVAVKIEQRR